MSKKFLFIFVLGIVIGFAIGFALEFRYHSNQIKIVVAESHRPSIGPKEGDTVTWLPSTTQVTFFGPKDAPSPCKGLHLGDNNNPCTVLHPQKGQESDTYLYKCTGCADPDWGPVNPPDPIHLAGMGLPGMAADATGDGVEVYCTSSLTTLWNGAGQVAANNPTILVANQSTSQTFYFSSAAGDMSFPAGKSSCTADSPANGCTVAANTAPGTFNFLVHGSQCTSDAANGGATEYVQIK